MKRVTLCFLVLTQLISTECSNEMFSANVHIESGLHIEKRLAELLTEYVESESAIFDKDAKSTNKRRENEDKKIGLEKLKQLAEFHLQQSEEALKNIETFVDNPINSFMFIKRLSVDWNRRFDPLILQDKDNDLVEKISFILSLLPDKGDLNGTVYSLNRLQDFYFLNLSEAANGNFRGVKSPKLSIDDCFIIGSMSFRNGDAYHSAMWMTAALEKMDSLNKAEDQEQTDVFDDENKMSTTDAKNKTLQILKYLSHAYYVLGNVTKVIPLLDRIIELNPNDYEAKINKDNLLKAMKDPSRSFSTMPTLPEFNINRHGYTSYQDFLNYTALCRGEKLGQAKVGNGFNSLKSSLKLKCRLVHNNNPRLILQPVKEEVMSIEPYLKVYHNVINDKEIDHLKEISSERIKWATKWNNQLKYYVEKNVRIVKNTWLEGDESPVVDKINKRIEDITGLSMENAEPLQVANYGVGGQYVPHCDCKCDPDKRLNKKVKGKRDRIATFMLYLSDVQEGGATVFINAGLSVKPQKGSAAFWYNLHKSGSADFQTWHAGCPVLLGNKWVANKWIHESGQEFRRPCGTTPDE